LVWTQRVLSEGSSASAPYRRAEGQASFRTRSKVAGGSIRQAQADSILSIRAESHTCDSWGTAEQVSEERNFTFAQGWLTCGIDCQRCYLSLVPAADCYLSLLSLRISEAWQCFQQSFAGRTHGRVPTLDIFLSFWAYGFVCGWPRPVSSRSSKQPGWRRSPPIVTIEFQVWAVRRGRDRRLFLPVSNSQWLITIGLLFRVERIPTFVLLPEYL